MNALFSLDSEHLAEALLQESSIVNRYGPLIAQLQGVLNAK